MRLNAQGKHPLAALLGVSMLVVGAGGALLVGRAYRLPPPPTPAFVEAAGRVVAVPTESCGTRNRPRTCYRPVVGYTVGGAARQEASRSRYRSTSPFRVGDPVPVLVGDDGSVWLKPEWDSRHQAARTEVWREKAMLYGLGSLLLGSALLGAVLVVAVLRAEEATPSSEG